MKYLFKKKGRREYKYVNGIKGMVTIFLVLIMTPMLSIAMALVETDRYQSVEEMMKEVVDGSANSTLADYDVYLRERFGLSAVTQERGAADVFDSYLNENNKALGKAAVLTDSTVNGVLPLTEPGVLREQVLENSKVNVVTEMEEQEFPIYRIMTDSSLKNEIKRVLDVNKVNNEKSNVDRVVGLSNDLIVLLEQIEAMEPLYGDYYILLDDYDEFYRQMYISVQDLVIELQYHRRYPDDASSEEMIEYYSEILDGYIEIFRKQLGKLKNAIVALDEQLVIVIDAERQLSDDVATAKSLIENSSYCYKLFGYYKDCADKFEDIISQWESNSYREKIDNLKSELERQVDLYADFSADKVKWDWILYADDTHEDITYDYFSQVYGKIANVRIFVSIMRDIRKYLNEIATLAKPVAGCANTLDGLVNVITEFSKISTLYDANIDANVTQAAMANVSGPGIDINNFVKQSSIVDVCNKGVGLVNEIKQEINKENLVNVIGAVKDYLVSYSNFLGYMGLFSNECLSYLDEFINCSASEAFGEKVALFGYGIYNLPNRTTYDSGATLYDYSFKKVFTAAGGSGSRNLNMSMSECATSGFSDSDLGTNTMFKGAETEYLLVGSHREDANQACTFMKIFLFRFITDFICTFDSNSATDQCDSSEIYGVFTQSLISIGESLAETIILSNGNDSNKKECCYEYLCKETYYLSPQGANTLVKDLLSINNGSAVVASINLYLQKATGSHTAMNSSNDIKTGQVKIRYDEALLFLSFAGISTSEFENRLQNIINSEAYTVYENNFALDKSWTTLYSEVAYKMPPLFGGVNLTNGGIFEGNVSQYVSY